jgi:hypothetical protein
LLNTEGKDYLSKNNELKFVSATSWILHGGKRYYEVDVNYYGVTQLKLAFDANGDLVWSASFNFLERWVTLGSPTSFDSNLTPAQIDELKARLTAQTAIQDFTPLQFLDCWQTAMRVSTRIQPVLSTFYPAAAARPGTCSTMQARM